MYDCDPVNEFAYVRERLNGILLRLSEEPFIRLSKTRVMQCHLSDIQWMLNHNHYPTPGQVDFFISLLRDEKFSVVREEGRHTKSTAEIQLMIDALKDIRDCLKLITRYEREGDIITLHSGSEWKNTALCLCLTVIFILCLAQYFIFSGRSPLGVYFCGVVLFFTVSLMLENKEQVFSFIGLIVFTLCSLFSWAWY
ncbi:hypothetical protein K7H21_28500 (plasmid) [Klebsiella sp. CTHL.F3a]|uniref:hypothetical protein n=1 Tax=Klebsiella sp. CTHL.F3a TaxID=2873296 RepID=UPI001CA6E837|nr:hypothetical protein [Klebsiella sp. CTHL.F3a]QZY82931.1 hypothetical protein K7H21_28500 [Klebsiella sp. CTHL.F3a]